MIKRVAPVLTDRLSMPRACIEHQHRAAGPVVLKNWIHLPLVDVIKVKEAVPSEDAIEALIKRQPSHIGNNPFVGGQALATERYHRG